MNISNSATARTNDIASRRKEVVIEVGEEFSPGTSMNNVISSFYDVKHTMKLQ